MASSHQGNDGPPVDPVAAPRPPVDPITAPRPPGPGPWQPEPPAPSQQLAGPLRRSRSDRVIAGVNGGLGRHLGVDPLWFRIATVILAVSSGAGIILYLAAWVLIPEEGTDTPAVHHAVRNDRGAIIGGLILVSIGLVLLLNVLLPWFNQVMWPLLLVAAGAALVFAGSRR